MNRMFGDEFTVNSYHHQAVGRLGSGLRPVAFSEKGALIEAVEHETLPLAAVQWHPERMTGILRYDAEGPDMAPVFERFCALCKEGVENESN